MSVSLGFNGYNMKSEAVSKIASEIVEKADAKAADEFIDNCFFNHCDHVPYTITVTKIDKVRAILISRIAQVMPRLTHLEIRDEVTANILNICFAGRGFLKHVAIRPSPCLVVADIQWPAKLYAISILN